MLSQCFSEMGIKKNNKIRRGFKDYEKQNTVKILLRALALKALRTRTKPSLPRY